MPVKQVRSLGDLKRATNLDGQEVHRENYLMFQNQMTRCLNTDTHFLFLSKRLGSTVLCTCGSPAVTCGYHAYKQYSSYIGNEVLVCHTFFQYGKHADNSS
jgi:hypothetical protein